MEPVQLSTSDEVTLHGDLQRSATEPERGSVVLCHPHPGYGGNRHNTVVDAIFRHLPGCGFHTLRFDFRSSSGDGIDEQLDVVAAIDHVAARFPDVPVHAVGYSFGAAVALRTGDPRVSSVVAIAPPLAVMAVTPPPAPVLVVVPEHDQFCPLDAARAAVESWPEANLEVVTMTDHFLAGRARVVAELTAEWLRGH